MRVQNSCQLQDIIYEEEVPYYNITNTAHKTRRVQKETELFK